MNIKEANSPFADGLANVIRAKGLRNMYVAEKAGYKPQELSDMLNGRKLIKACDILKLSIVLGVTANDIYAAGKEVRSDAE